MLLTPGRAGERGGEKTIREETLRTELEERTFEMLGVFECSGVRNVRVIGVFEYSSVSMVE